jgi:hypothetical protein
MCVVVGSKIPNMKENKNHPIRKKRKIRGLDIDDLLGLLGIGEFLGVCGQEQILLFLDQKHLGIFWINVFSSVNLIKFVKLLGENRQICKILN